jgi:hypothetical protein
LEDFSDQIVGVFARGWDLGEGRMAGGHEDECGEESINRHGQHLKPDLRIWQKIRFAFPDWAVSFNRP